MLIRPSLLALLIGLSGCDHRPASLASREPDDVALAMAAGTNAVYFHTSTVVVDSLKPLLLSKLRLALDSIDRVAPVRNLQIRVSVFPDAVLPPFGLSGVSDSSRIDLFLDPGHPDLRKGIAEALVPTLAHEYYHVMRGRTAGYGTTLFEAMVSEGLAEHFVREVTGRPPPWLGSIPSEQQANWRRRAAAIWCRPEYDHAAWFVGNSSDIPRGLGFAIGFAMVGEYLAAHPGEKPSTLQAAAPRVFLPAQLRGDSTADCWRSFAGTSA